jgi:hypothetical protein
MSTRLAERIVSYLKNEARDVRRVDLEQIALKHKYSKEQFYDALREVQDTVANIGQWQDQVSKQHLLRYYPPTELTDQVQECLDRGEDW